MELPDGQNNTTHGSSRPQDRPRDRMSAQIQFWLSLAMLLGSVPVLGLTRKSLAGGVVYFIAAEVSAVLLNAHYVADQMTGEGINEAALYHIRYGLRHVAYGAYPRLVITGLSSLVGSTLVFGFFAFRPRLRSGKAGLVVALMLVGTSLCLNPSLQNLSLHLRGSSKQSDFYQFYRSPYITSSPGKAPLNLIYIYAEGFERTFFDENLFPGLISELRKLEAEGTSFTNIGQIKGTNWTMGGIVASLCGIPLITPAVMGGNSMSGMDTYLTGAMALSDLLKEKDYHLTFIGGANSSFAGKRDFLATHGFAEILGREELAPKLQDPTHLSHWGLYDESTLEFSLNKYRELAAGKGPFALFLLTLDTHYPNPVSPKVSSIKYGDGSNPMLNAIAASDSLIGEFVRDIRATPEARNTVIVIASDHFTMWSNPAVPLLNAGKRSNMFIVLDPKHQGRGKISTPGTMLDVGATIIPFLGWRGALGLGRDLLDEVVSLDERQKIQSPDRQAAWEDDIIRFWEFPRITDYIEFDPKTSRVAIGGRRFKVPVLIDLSDNLMTRLKFEFDASAKEQMLDQFIVVHELGDAFILITTKQRARLHMPEIRGPGEEWCIVIGRHGQRLNWLNAAGTKRLTKAEIERYIAKPDKP